MEIGNGCVYIDAQAAPHNGLVIGKNPNGSFDVAVVTEDAKRRTRAGSADWGLVFDRILHVESFPAKLKFRLNTENEAAVNERRDADFDNIGQECITESLVEGWHRIHLETQEDGKTQKVVSIQLFGSEHDELPEEHTEPLPPVEIAAEPIMEPAPAVPEQVSEPAPAIAQNDLVGNELSASQPEGTGETQIQEKEETPID